MPHGDELVTPRRRPKQYRAERTRDRILTAATHVFAEYGYAAGTTNRIAAEAHVSIGSLYQYFPNKHSILAELVTRHVGGQQMHGEAAGGVDLLTISLLDALRHVVQETIENHSSEPQLLRIMIEHTTRSADLVDKVHHYELQRRARIRHLLKHHPEARVIDVDTAARVIVATVELVVHQLMADPEPVDAQNLKDELTAMLYRYVA